MVETKSRGEYRLLVVLAALLFSTGGVAIKACTLSAWQVAGFRSAVAAIALFALLPGARRRCAPPIALTACAYAATLICFVLATKLGTSAGAIFLQSTAPLYMLLFSPLILREKIERADILVFAAILGGMALLLRGGFGGNAAGNVAGVLSGLTWALTLTGLRWLGKHRDSGAGEATVAWGNLIAFLACLPVSLPLPHLSVADSAVILYLGVFQIALAYVLLTRSIRYLPAVETATLLLIEPVFNPLWAALLRHENPGPFVLGGGAVISLSACLGAWWKAREHGHAQSHV